MNGIVAWFARHAVAANLLMIVAFIGGIFAFNSMEREVFPAADFNGASVSIAWPGASPKDVEDQIVVRLEEVMADIDGLKRMSGTAREGVGYVNLEANNDTDIDRFTDEVKLRVDQINNLPRSSYPPQVTRWRAEQPYIGMAVHGDIDRRALKRITDRIRDEIALLPGGELAQVDGILAEEVSIEVSEDALRRYNLTFSDVAEAVRGSSLNSSGGRVRTDTGEVTLQTRQLADTQEQFENIVIRQTIDGGAIRVRDIATVIDGFEDAELATTHDGELTTFIFIVGPEKMDIINFADGIKDYIKKKNETLPDAVSIDLLWDDSVVFKDRMNTIASSALLGSALVLIVLLLFLRPLVALWVTIGIITAFAGGIMLLPFFGVSFNMLSLFAVLLVIGVVVDDAIIVGENIHREVESGRRKGVDAAIIGTQIVLKPVIFGVLTTIIAFAPWMFLSGPERQFTSQISYVVIAALTFSLIESMLILPAHLAHMEPQKFDGVSGWIIRAQRRIADSLLWFAEHLYKPVLEAAIRYRYATLAFFVSIFLIGNAVVANGFVAFRFMPQIEADLVQVTIDLPDGTPFSRSLQVRDQLQTGVDALREEMDAKYPDLEKSFINGASIVADNRSVRAWIGLVDPEIRPQDAPTKVVAQRLRELVGPVPDAEEVEFDFTFNDGSNRIEFALNHPDLDTLRRAADEVKKQLATYGTTYDIGDNLSSAAEEVRITMKPGAEALGVTLAQVSNQVRQAYYGEEAQRLPRDGEDVRVMVRLPEADRSSLDSLRNLRIRVADGREIPLSEVAEFNFAPGVNRILRRERIRSVTVKAELTGDVQGQIRSDLNENFWPEFEKKFPEVTRGAVGEFESQQEFVTNVRDLFIIALGAMYILLAIAFRSYAQPLLIMTAIPFAYAGAVFGHLAFGIPMAMFSIFGIGAAAGVVINDNLVLLDFVNRQRERGVGAVQSLVNAGVSRFRPILLTSVTTFVGVLPMIAERSTQAQFLKPMVVSLGSAVAFALFISLFMVPALYAVGVEIGRVFRWSWAGVPYRHIGEGYSGEVDVIEEELTDHPESVRTEKDPNRPDAAGGFQPAE